MRNHKKLSSSFMRSTAAMVFFLGLGSMTEYQDPSLMAAEEYNPDLWNGRVSNDYLRDIMNDHASDIETITNKLNGEISEYPRNLYNDMQIPLILAEMFHKGFETASRESGLSEFEYIQSLSVYYSIPYLRMTLLYGRLKEALNQLQYQDNANCYAYGTNDYKNEWYSAATGLRKNDGRYPDLIITTDTIKQKNFQEFVTRTIRGAEHDGLIFTGTHYPTKPGYYRIVLYVAPAKDASDEPLYPNRYHWIRQNRDGTWSHKNANLNVINVDFNGQPITDLIKADFGEHKFVGYFLVPQGGIDVETSPQPQTAPQVETITVTARRPI